MNYSEALELMIRGKKLTRKAWKKNSKSDCYTFLANNIRIGNCVDDIEVTPALCFKTDIPTIEVGWQPAEEDREAKDWEELE